MIDSKKVSAIIPSAGVGKRMSGLQGVVIKQFIPLQGKPLLSYTIEKFEKSKYIDEIIIVCTSELISYIQNEIIEPFRFEKVKKLVSGGKERQDSVYQGFKAIDQANIVLVHDGVRPFVKTEKIDELIETCNVTGAAILAVKPKDTIKEQDSEQNVKTTLDRSKLWNIQTPQAFDYPILGKAFKAAYEDGYYGTDESMLVERVGKKIKIVEGNYDNIKITSPDDLILAEFIVSSLR